MVWLQFCLFVLSWLLCPFLNLGLWIFFISSRARMTLLPWQVFLYMLDLQVQFPKIFPVDGKHAFLCFNYLGFFLSFPQPSARMQVPTSSHNLPRSHSLCLPPGMVPMTQNCQLSLSRSLREHYRHTVKRASIYGKDLCAVLVCKGLMSSPFYWSWQEWRIFSSLRVWANSRTM